MPNTSRPLATVAFTDEQQHCLSTLASTLEGKTGLQQNPYPPQTWATWIIAQLGSWSGYTSQNLRELLL